MRTGQYDGVSASGNATARLVEGGDVAPVNTDLVPNYATVFDDLKDQPYNTFDGVNYGIPHGRGANLLMWNKDTDPDIDGSTWAPILDPNEASKYSGKISVYDDPIYIADAALYLKAHQPDLGIDNPYELDEDQFNAAVDLLKQQRPNVGEYWSDFAKQISSFANGDVDRRHHLAVPVLHPAGRDGSRGIDPGRSGLPPGGGRHRLVGHLDDQQRGRASELHVHVDGPHHQSGGERRRSPPGSARRRPRASRARSSRIWIPRTSGPRITASSTTRTTRSSGRRVYYWKTPLADCGDDRGEVCMDYNDWVSAWTEIKG